MPHAQVEHVSVVSVTTAPLPAAHIHGGDVLLQEKRDDPVLISGTKVHEEGMVTEVKGQPENACTPMEVTEEGIAIEAREVQPEKAAQPMEVTEEGINTEAREGQ